MLQIDAAIAGQQVTLVGLADEYPPTARAAHQWVDAGEQVENGGRQTSMADTALPVAYGRDRRSAVAPL